MNILSLHGHSITFILMVFKEYFAIILMVYITISPPSASLQLRCSRNNGALTHLVRQSVPEKRPLDVFPPRIRIPDYRPLATYSKNNELLRSFAALAILQVLTFR